MNPADNLMTGQVGRLPVSATGDPIAPTPIPPRPISYNTADPVLVALVRMDPSADPTSVAFLQAADAVAAQLDSLEAGADDATVRELLGTLGGPPELVAAVHYRYAVQRAGAPGANVAAEREAEQRALAALESWAAGIVAAWTRSTYQVAPELEAVVDRRLTVAIDAGTLGELLEQTANATDEVTQRTTARLVVARIAALDPRLLAEAQSFVDFVRGVDVLAALELQTAAGKARAQTANLLGALAG